MLVQHTKSLQGSVPIRMLNYAARTLQCYFISEGGIQLPGTDEHNLCLYSDPGWGEGLRDSMPS